MDMAVNAAGGENQVLAGDDLGPRADHQARIDAGLDKGVAGLADGDNAAGTNANIALDDAPVVEDDGIRDDEVQGRVRLPRVTPGARG